MSNTQTLDQISDANKFLKEYVELTEYIHNHEYEFDSATLLIIQRELQTFETNLRSTFEMWINPTKPDLTQNVEFLTSEEFLNRSGLLTADSMPDSTSEEIVTKAKALVTEAKKAIKIQGVRATKTGDILVHTTDYTKKVPEPLSITDATYTAMHEVVHGYVDPQITMNDDGQIIERQTGCKRIRYNESGEIEETEHAELYEVINDLLVVLANPHIQSWEQVTSYFRKKQDFLGLNHTDNIIEFCGLMKFFKVQESNGDSLKDFEAARQFLAKTHFHFNKETTFEEELIEHMPLEFRERIAELFNGILIAYPTDIFTREFRGLTREMQVAA